MQFNGRVRPIFSLLLICSLAGCTAMSLIASTKIRKPDFKYVDYRAGDPELRKVTIYLEFNATNPNKIGLRNVFASYELYAEDNRFLKGNDIALTLAPSGETRVEVPAEVVYRDFFRALGPAAREILSGSKTLPVTAKVTIFGKPTVYTETENGSLFSFSYTTTEIINVPIPRDKIEEFRNRAEERVKGLF